MHEVMDKKNEIKSTILIGISSLTMKLIKNYENPIIKNITL